VFSVVSPRLTMPATPAVISTHAPTSTTTLHVPNLPHLAPGALSTNVNTSDPKVQQGALYGAAAVAIAGASALGLYKLYQYYTLKTTQYKLSYFNGRALAEVSRYLFALAGVEYIDHRYPSAPPGSNVRPGFDEIKDTLPFGQLPILQVGGDNGIILAQSKSIDRFLARRFGYLGSNDIEAQLIDSVVEAVRDARDAYFKNKDNPVEKEKFFTGTLHTTLRYINRLANAHSTSADRNTIVGSSISLADVSLYHFLSIFDDQVSVSRTVDNFPVVKASRANFGNQPQILEWIAKRPNTPW